MEKLIDKVSGILKAEFPSAVLELEQDAPDGKIGGFLIWRGFYGLEQIKRQRRLTRALRDRLSTSDKARLTMIFTLTPAECRMMRAEASAAD